MPEIPTGHPWGEGGFWGTREGRKEACGAVTHGETLRLGPQLCFSQLYPSTSVSQAGKEEKGGPTPVHSIQA